MKTYLILCCGVAMVVVAGFQAVAVASNASETGSLPGVKSPSDLSGFDPNTQVAFVGEVTAIEPVGLYIRTHIQEPVKFSHDTIAVCRSLAGDLPETFDIYSWTAIYVDSDGQVQPRFTMYKPVITAGMRVLVIAKSVDLRAEGEAGASRKYLASIVYYLMDGCYDNNQMLYDFDGVQYDSAAYRGTDTTELTRCLKVATRRGNNTLQWAIDQLRQP